MAMLPLSLATLITPREATPQARTRIAALDGLRGVAIVLMLVDHVIVPIQATHTADWGQWFDLRLLTRPALPLFMLLSGSLFELRLRGRSGTPRASMARLVGRQLWRVAPWVAGATLAAALIPGMGLPEVLTTYMLGTLGLVVFRGWEWVGAVLCLLYALAIPDWWSGYDPLEAAGWLLVGVLITRYAGDWWSRLPALPRWLAAVGRHPLGVYTGQLALIALGCVIAGLR